MHNSYQLGDADSDGRDSGGTDGDAFDRFLRSLPSPDSNHRDVADVDTYRVVVATDWSNVTLPITVLRAYAAMIPPSAPVTLVVTLPHSPSLADATNLDLLLQDVELKGVELQDVKPRGRICTTLESFADTRGRPALIAFIPGGDQHVLISELGRGLVAMHHLADHVRTPGAIAASPPPRRGPMPGLAARLQDYRELPGPS